MRIEEFLYCELEGIILDKFNRVYYLDLSDIDLTKKVIGFVSFKTQDFYSNEYNKIICKYNIISADISIYSFVWIIILSFVFFRLANLFYNLRLFAIEKPLNLFWSIFLFIVTFVIGLLLCIFIKDLFRLIFNKEITTE